jgi:flagellar motor switch protein FliN/FliY
MTDTDLETMLGEEGWAAAPAGDAAADSERAAVAEPKPAQIFPQFAENEARTEHLHDFEMILDIPVQLAVEFGRTRMSIRSLLQLAHGSVIELDALAGEPLDVLVNGTLIAQGEVVVVNDKFGIRLTDIVTPSERMRKLKR